MGWSTVKEIYLFSAVEKILSSPEKTSLVHICVSTVPCYLLFLLPSTKYKANRDQLLFLFQKGVFCSVTVYGEAHTKCFVIVKTWFYR